MENVVKRKRRRRRHKGVPSKYRKEFLHLAPKPPPPRQLTQKGRTSLAKSKMLKIFKDLQKVQYNNPNKRKRKGVIVPCEQDLIIEFEQLEKAKYLKGKSNLKLKNSLDYLFTENKLEELMNMDERSIEPNGVVLKNKKKRVKRVAKENVRVISTSNIDATESSAARLLRSVESSRVIPVYDPMDIGGGTLKEDLLSPLEHKFAIIFAQTGNATRSAELSSVRSSKAKGHDVDHKDSYFRRLGSDLLKRPQVQRAIGLLQKKVCIAAALDAAEVISNIREIAALATVNEKYDAAIKANLLLGEYLGIFGKTKEERMKTVNQQTQVIDVFKTGEDLVDNTNDIMKLSTQLGIAISSASNERDTY